MTASNASVRGQPAAGGLAVMVVLHDLNEAAFVAGRLVACGPPASVLTPAALEAVHAVPFRAAGGVLVPDSAA